MIDLLTAAVIWCTTPSVVKVDAGTMTTTIYKCETAFDAAPAPAPQYVNIFAARQKIRGTTERHTRALPKKPKRVLPKAVAPSTTRVAETPVTVADVPQITDVAPYVAVASQEVLRTPRVTKRATKRLVPCKKGRSRNNPRRRCERPGK